MAMRSEEDAERRRRAALGMIVQGSGFQSDTQDSERRLQSMMKKRERAIKRNQKLEQELAIASGITDAVMAAATGGVSLAAQGTGGVAKAAVKAANVAGNAAKAADASAAASKAAQAANAAQAAQATRMAQAADAAQAVTAVGAADRAAEAATKTTMGALGKAAQIGKLAAAGGKSKAEKTTNRVINAITNPVQLGKEIGMAILGQAPFEERLKRYDQRIGRIAARRQRQLEDGDVDAFINFGRIIS